MFFTTMIFRLISPVFRKYNILFMHAGNPTDGREPSTERGEVSHFLLICRFFHFRDCLNQPFVVSSILGTKRGI